MSMDLRQAIATGVVTKQQAEKLKGLEPGTYCVHRSWGFGRVVEWRVETGQLVVDFEGKPGHLMQLGYAADTLQALGERDVRVRARTEPEEVRKAALAAGPAERMVFMRELLEAMGGKALVEEILGVLVPHVLDEESAKEWWSETKRLIRKNQHFVVPTRKSEPVMYLAEPEERRETFLERFRKAQYLQEQHRMLLELEKNFEDYEREVVGCVGELSAAIEEAAGRARKGQEGLAIVMLLVRDEVLHIVESRHGVGGVKTTMHAYDFLVKYPNRMEKFFEEVPAAWHKALLEQMELAFGEQWIERVLELLRKATPRLAATIYNLFREKEIDNLINGHIFRWIAERSAPSDLLYWICKRRKHECAVFFTPSLFNAILTAMEVDQLSETRRGRKLASLLLQDRRLFEDLFSDESLGVTADVEESATLKGAKSKKRQSTKSARSKSPSALSLAPLPSIDSESRAETLRDAFRRLKASSVFDDLEKRTLLGRLLKIDPTLEQILSTTQAKVEDVPTVSWASLERVKAELDDIVNRLIPHYTREIQKAKEYGDLRENFEYKSAKEQQTLLTKRQAELESTLARAQGTNFENPDTSRVSIGTTITLTDVSSGAQQTYSILGAWDSAPEEGIISYRAALGQSLLGKEPGDEVPLADGRILRIERIEPFRNLELLKKIHQYKPPILSESKN